MAFRCSPPEFVFNDTKIKNDFSDIKLYSLRILAIKKKNFMSLIFHDLSFEK